MITRARDHGAELALAALLVLAFVVMAFLGRGTTFYFDEWNFWVAGPSLAPADLLEPYNGQASLVPRLWWTAVAGMFGEGDYLPFRLAWYPLHLALFAGIYVLLRPRTGGWLALAVVVPMTVLGTGLASMAMWMPITGLYFVLPLVWLVWALVALDRGTRRGDVVACVLLVLAAFTSSSGLAALAGAAAFLLWERPQWRRLWIAAVPTVLFALWFLIQRPENEQPITASDVTLVPAYIAEGIGAGLGTYTSLGPPYGWPLAIAVIVGIVVAFARGVPLSRTFVGLLAAGLAFWALLAIGRGPELRPDQARYQYPDVVYAVVPAVLLLAMLRRDPRRTAIIALVLGVGFALPNLNAYVDRMRFERGASQRVRAHLTAIELAASGTQGRLSAFKYRPLMDPRADPVLSGQEYLHRRSQGLESVAYPLSEVDGLDGYLKRQVDRASLEMLAFKPRPHPEPLDGVPCRTVRPTGEPTTALTFPANEPFTVQALGDETADLRLRRYATEFDPKATAAAEIKGEQVVIEIPRDRSDRPWEANVASFGPFKVCARGSQPR